MGRTTHPLFSPWPNQGALFSLLRWTPITPLRWLPSDWLDSWNKVCPVTLSMAFNFLRKQKTQLQPLRNRFLLGGPKKQGFSKE